MLVTEPWCLRCTNPLSSALASSRCCRPARFTLQCSAAAQQNVVHDARIKVPNEVVHSTVLAGKIVAVVGGGPAGLNAAMNLARLGARSVDVFDERTEDALLHAADVASPFVSVQARGADALAASGVDLAAAGPSMRFAGVSIHKPDGACEFGLGWGKEVELMFGCDSVTLTQFVRERALERYPVIALHQGYRLVDADLAARRLEFEECGNSGARRSVVADLVVGADGGASSAVRRFMTQQVPGFTFSLETHPSEGVGVRFPHLPGAEDVNALGTAIRLLPESHGSDNYLATGNTLAFFWPRSKRVGTASIATTPEAKSGGLFYMPSAFWREHTDEASVRAAIIDCFPQLPLFCVDAFTQAAINPTLRRRLPPTVKCSAIAAPGVVLVGDAAHSVSPAFGQGIQAAFEDGVCLADAIVQAQGDIELACCLYNNARLPEVHALAEMDSCAVSMRRQNLKGLIWSATLAATQLLTQQRWLPAALRPGPFFTLINSQPFTRTRAVLLRILLVAVGCVSVGLAGLAVGATQVLPIVASRL